MRKAIVRYSENPGLDIINFFEQVLCSFLTGNADMHLKNFSLIDQPGAGYILAPAYDMVASNLVVKGDDEELALTLNGKKKKILQKDFLEVSKRFGIAVDILHFIHGMDSNKKYRSVLPRGFLLVSASDRLCDSIHRPSPPARRIICPIVFRDNSIT